MPLADLLKPKTPTENRPPLSLADAAATVAKLEREARAARFAADDARSLYSSLLCDFAEGRSAPHNLDAYEADALKLEAKATATERALALAKDRLVAAEASAAKTKNLKAWENVQALSEKRQEAIKALGDRLGALAQAYSQYVSATRSLEAALPMPAPDMDGSALRRGMVEAAMISELARLGLDLGCKTSPSLLHSTPPFADRFDRAHQVVLSWRPRVAKER
ncbi:MAG: hypothetical protein ACK55V_11790 [Alphaproteobacteria bacterium]